MKKTNMDNQEVFCDVCNRKFYIQESYGVDGRDETYETEIGHAWTCPFRNIDPNNRPYVKMK